MKYLKTFETINKIPQVGDYIIAHISRTAPKPDVYNIDYFLLNNIGEVLSVNKRVIYVKYIIDKSLPRSGAAQSFREWFIKIDKTKLYMAFSLDKIDEIFQNKEHAIAYLAAKKYNL